jgi:hypothetical protein
MKQQIHRGTDTSARKDRLAAALRDNLKRRKVMMRRRDEASQAADIGEGTAEEATRTGTSRAVSAEAPR